MQINVSLAQGHYTGQSVRFKPVTSWSQVWTVISTKSDYFLMEKTKMIVNSSDDYMNTRSSALCIDNC